MIHLGGKRIFVSGAGAGMGAAVALLSTRAGAEVLATDKFEDGLLPLIEAGCTVAVLDVTEQQAVDLFSRLNSHLTGLLTWQAGYIMDV